MITDVYLREHAGPAQQIVNQVINAVVLAGLAASRITANDRRTVNATGRSFFAESTSCSARFFDS